MTVVEFIKSKISRCTNRTIEFSDNSRCSKNVGDLIKWSTKNYIGFLEDEDIKGEASKGPTYFNKAIKDGFQEIIKEKNIEVKNIENTVEGVGTYNDSNLFTTNLVPVIDSESKDKRNLFIMVDTEDQNRISDMTFAAWELKQDPDYVKAAILQAMYVRQRYVPTTTKSFIPSDLEKNNPTPILNTYYPPKHRLEKINKPQIPTIVVDFLKRLFVNTECYNFMMESIWYVINDRLQVIPVLNGGTGIGKGLFTEFLLGGLVGKGNAILAPASWDKSGFNAWLLKKQLIVFDEAKIISNGPDSNVDYLKRMMNDSLNVERKGIDADTLTDNYASFFITSNNGAKRFRLELDNRRFSPIDVTDQKVERVYNKKDRESLVELLQDETVIANIYWEIQNNWDPSIRNPQRTPHTILQCESLYKFQYESLDIWQKAICDIVLSRESNEYCAGELNAFYRKIYTQITGRETNTKRVMNKVDVKDFLQSYRHYGSENAMAVLREESDGEMVLIPSEEYRPIHGNFRKVGLDAL